MRTEGDRLAEAKLAAVGGKGLFVREIEEAVLRGDADIAVHSLKDLPAEPPAGLWLGAFLEREDARDVFIGREPGGFDELPSGAVLGTSSPRRQALIRASRPDLMVTPLRGNVDTRLRKLEAGECDAIVLAAAGLRRLGLTPRHERPLPVEVFVPAVGQGVLAVEARVGDDETKEALAVLNHAETRACALVERSYLACLGASCVTPTAAHARLSGDRMVLDALVASEDGRTVIRESATARVGGGEVGGLGVRVAQRLLARGAAGVVALRPAGVGDGR